MKTGVYYKNSDVRVEEQPVPELEHGEILIKVMASGICGSDVMEWYRIKKAPLVLGHELTGVVERKADGVRELAIGDRVIVTHHVPCNECNRCMAGNHTSCELLHQTRFYPGGFAQYLRVPEINIVKGGVLKLPNKVSFEDGTFIEPLGCVLRGQRACGQIEGRIVLVIGSGQAGLLHIKAARAGGARKVVATDINEYRLDFARRAGANHYFNSKEFSAEKLKSVNEGKLADIVVICTGAQAAIKQAYECVEPGGKILFFATPMAQEQTPFPIAEFWKNSISIITSYAASPQDLKEALEMIASKKIKVGDMITHRLPLEKIQEGFNLTAGSGESMKVIIEPNRM